MFFYSDQRDATSVQVDISKLNATKQWLKHYSNSLELKWLQNHSQTTSAEKVQATKEMAICERKMKFWARQPNYDRDAALRGAEELKRNWRK